MPKFSLFLILKLKGLNNLYFQLLNLGQLAYLHTKYPLFKSIHNSLLLASRHKIRSNIPIISTITELTRLLLMAMDNRINRIPISVRIVPKLSGMLNFQTLIITIFIMDTIQTPTETAGTM